MIDKGIQQGMEQDARRIVERIPDKMVKQNILDVRLRLKELIGQQGWSLKQVGNMVGRSSSTISLFLQGKYKGDSVGLAKKLHQLMESHARRKRRPRGQAFVQTAVAKKIFTVIKQTEAFSDDKEGKIGVIIGDGGHGKSHCLRQYAEINEHCLRRAGRCNDIDTSIRRDRKAIRARCERDKVVDYPPTYRCTPEPAHHNHAGRGIAAFGQGAKSAQADNCNKVTLSPYPGR